jgi:glycosyltransferase involved in cell wall biosynthesis
VHTDNRGVSAARSHAVRQTRAPLIALLDGDDLFRPAYLETMVTALEGDASIRLATCDARMFGAVPRERTCVNG